MVIFDFAEKSEPDRWQVVNDGVMGGLSQATFELGENGRALFTGEVSLDNNGGFSSVRYNTEEINVEGYSTLVLYLKGDGKKYQVRISENSSDYYSYIAYFESSGKEETIEILLNNMYPTFRGRKLDLPNFNGNTIVELTFLIGNSRAEKFSLELQKAILK